ncbi:(p)ppGpp synthetase [Pectobacterium carotovorum subsp. carotovorum]|uniref:GTP pyrophosphokinase n=1 Tax=Pectobacterium carotovorum TaxID=554 RepID=UPI001373D3E3|nr:RelA/SpoT domain-containing protein [Pectobacterium carotovorum]MCL6365258.1 (p)ppGpp synthetase [Pectobacterium carotovorum subsp. carotovorum]QHP58876.1 (p)ppGpp synthetase [Pectobacterium carotovorum subsp. carotovorum]
MNEAEFIKLWHAEKAMYDAWGQLIVDSISSSLSKCLNVDLKSYLKIPAEHRVKEDGSLIDKAFYRNKAYQDPYNDIEDKVGVRFVVMLQSDAERVCEIIAQVADSQGWDAVQCRNYNEERNKSPMLFTYQSHHFIIRSREPIVLNGITISENTPCEVQVRSLLQHAYAELTHDAIYKKKTIVEPEVTRTVAKTMAFIETADEFFQKVVDKTESKTVAKNEPLLDTVFEEITGIQSVKQNSSIIIYDTFQNFINENFEEEIEKFIEKNPNLGDVIKEKTIKNKFYQQSVIIFIYWLIRRKKSAIESEWPLEWKIISDMATDVGVALNRMT